MTDLAGVLRELYERQLRALPAEVYLRQHAEPGFLNGAVQVFQLYEPYLPAQGRILDWGCRHAPDACLIRARFGDRIELDGCDVFEPDQYPIFFSYSRLQYTRLSQPVRLPYADETFDAVIASGVLEHVPMDYESLKELNRILKPKGRLIVSYLPNRNSLEEWRLRSAGAPYHQRLYGPRQLREKILHTGFLPLILGFQTQLDLLAPASAPVRILRPLFRLLNAQRFTACLCAVAEKTIYF